MPFEGNTTEHHTSESSHWAEDACGKKTRGLLVAVHVIEMRQQQVRGKAFRVPEEHSICCVSASVWINRCLPPERARSRRGDGSGAPRGALSCHTSLVKISEVRFVTQPSGVGNRRRLLLLSLSHS